MSYLLNHYIYWYIHTGCGVCEEIPTTLGVWDEDKDIPDWKCDDSYTQESLCSSTVSSKTQTQRPSVHGKEEIPWPCESSVRPSRRRSQDWCPAPQVEKCGRKWRQHTRNLPLIVPLYYGASSMGANSYLDRQLCSSLLKSNTSFLAWEQSTGSSS